MIPISIGHFLRFNDHLVTKSVAEVPCRGQVGGLRRDGEVGFRARQKPTSSGYPPVIKYWGAGTSTIYKAIFHRHVVMIGGLKHAVLASLTMMISPSKAKY